MAAYVVRRLLLMIPTLFGIILLNFLIVQIAPGGPVEQMIAKLQGMNVNATQNFNGSGSDTGMNAQSLQRQMDMSSGASAYRGAQGLDPAFVKSLEKQFGFDKPPGARFLLMLKNYLTFNFGDSYFQNKRVTALIIEKLPVSISLGLWSTLLIYLVSIPLGIRKAVKDGSAFDVWTSGAIVAGYAIPGFLFAIFLIVLFAGGQYFQIFPLRGIVSDNWAGLDWPHRILDYFWHITLPVISLSISGFAGLTILTKNSFLEEINKQYVLTARAKGLTENRILYKHVFRNAMLIVISGFPAALMSVFLTGSVLIETIFSLDGIGLLGFTSALNRDYPVMFGTLYIFTLIGFFIKLVSDLTMTFVDPRIDFEAQEAR
ncbi:MAG: microcin C ABC transporter permease YejB [Alphaproteobacteria bacterium]|nr:microcin C ABC transporter permease YejB [Alphaproteobacteria bacterium]MDE2335755.1 microcin C ABC transporter permease YejB [Alphaproteobacteria bacterium]